MNEQMNILLEVLEEIKQQNRELKTSVSNLASQPISTTTSSEEDGISLTDVARLIGQKIEIDGKFKSELTDVAIVLGKRIREIKDGITKTQEKQAESIASLSEKIQETQSPPTVKKYYLFDVKRWVEWLIWGISIILLACTIGWAVYLCNANQTLESYVSATASYVWSKAIIAPLSPISTVSSLPKTPPTPFTNYATKSATTNSQSNAKQSSPFESDNSRKNKQKFKRH